MDNYQFFVYAYLLLWLIPFLVFARILLKVNRLESRLSEVQKEKSDRS